MPNILLPLQAGEWPQGLCPPDWPQALVAIANALKAVLPGQTFYNYGDTKPAPEFQAYPWLRTIDARWYQFTGSWISPNQETSADVRRIFVGDAAALAAYDGGAAGAVTANSGPMWEVDTVASARFLVGAGTFPSTLVVAVGGVGGAEQHTLTDAEGGVGQHTHAFGLSNPGNDDAYFKKAGAPGTVPGYLGYYITGSNGNIELNQTTADLFTLPSGAAGAGVTPTPFSLLPPYYGVWIIKRTARLNYVVP